MKTTVLGILTVLVLLLTASAIGQDLPQKKTLLQPEIIEHNGRPGVFVSFEFMDMNAEKLIDRKSLFAENMTMREIIKSLEEQTRSQNKALQLSEEMYRVKSQLYNSAESQISLLNDSLKNQKQITSIVKKKARKNGLLLFGGGVAVGVTAFALLIN